MAGRKGLNLTFKTIAHPAARIGCRIGAVALALGMGAGSVHDATALGETRSLSFHHTHSGEDLTVTFKRNGRYDEDALKKLNWFLRDWRSQDQTTMNRQLFDILWEVYRDVDAKDPVHIISSYRSPKTNAMLRRRSSGVARFSQHMQGNAMDFFIPNVALDKVRAAGLRMQRGGVGFYPTSGSPFVHLDTGHIRHWPRMTRDQLVRVFPNGRTVHVPTDGNPLPGYQLALSDVSRRKSGGDADNAAPRVKPTALASLLGLRSDDDEDDAKSAPAAATASAQSKTTAAKDEQPTASAKPSAAAPQRAQPPARYQVASVDVISVDVKKKPADTVVAPRTGSDPGATTAAKTSPPTKSSTTIANAPKAAASPPPLTPVDVINARGFWNDDPAAQARAAIADPQFTASVASSDGRAAADHQALAYATPSLVDRTHVVAATAAPVPRLRSAARASAVVTQGANAHPATAQPTSGEVAKGVQPSPAAKSIAANAGHEPWMRALIVSPSARDFLAVTAFGEPDLTTLRSLMVKPRMVVAMTFAEEGPIEPASEQFTGSAQGALPTITFAVRTASLK